MAGDLRADTWLIDNDGQHWPWPYAELGRRLDFAGADGELASYAIDRLGFAGVSTRADRMHVRFHPATIAQAALVELFYLLSDRQPDTVGLSYLAGEWRHEIRGGRAAVTRIGEIVDQAREEARVRFCARRLPLGANGRLPKEQFGELLGRWRRERRVRDLASLTSRLDRLFHGRFIVARGAPDPGRLTIFEVGDGFPQFDRAWLEQARGRPLDEAPDASFGAWIHDTYRDVLREGAPRLEDVEALIRTTDGRLHHARCRRMILPHVGPDDEPVVVSAMLVDDCIKLLVRAAEA